MNQKIKEKESQMEMIDRELEVLLNELKAIRQQHAHNSLLNKRLQKLEKRINGLQRRYYFSAIQKFMLGAA